MQQKAEVRELKQKTKVPDSPDEKWLAHMEKKITELDKEEKKTIAKTMWKRGMLLLEVRKKFRYREGFVKWVEGRFEYCVATAYNHMAIYVGCPNPKLLRHFPLWLLRRIGSSNCPEELRKLIQDNAKELRKDLTEKVYKEIEDKVRRLGFDTDDSELNEKLFEEREKKAKEYDYREKIDRDLKAIAEKWNAFDAAARTGLEPDENDEYVWLTEEQEKLPIREKLTELGYLPKSKYKVFVEADVSNA